MASRKTKLENGSDDKQTLLSRSVDQASHDFAQNVDSVRRSHSIVMGPVVETHERCRNAWREFMLKNELGTLRQDESEIIDPVSPFPPHRWHEHRRLLLEMDAARRVRIFMPRSCLGSLVSAFDWLMAALLRTVLSGRPQLLNAKEAMTYERLCKFENISEARLYVLNHEVDSLLRDSREKQFKWLERSLGLATLRGDKELWASFVEVEQRRHMFVHCNGHVTEDYLTECKRHGVALPDGIRTNDTLTIDAGYFNNACSQVMEMGAKLTQVVWRKVLPNDARADGAFTDMCYQHILREDYPLAIRLLDFAIETSAFKFHDRNHVLPNVLNLAQAYKWSGDDDACSRVLEKEDWSATNALFRMAKACLEGKFEDALKLVEEIGADCPDVDQSYYRDWPIFKELREQKEFPNLVERIFGQPLYVAESVDLGAPNTISDR